MPPLPLTELSKRSFFVLEDRDVIETIFSLDPKTFFCTLDGRIVHDFCNNYGDLPKDAFFQLHFRILGGKGGFGSLLRSFRVNKSTNQLMCRDLSGRRLASIDEEQKLKKWIERAAEREREKIERRKAKYEKLKAGPPKHMFNDPDYMRQKETIIEKTEEAFEEGFLEALKTEREKKEKPVESSSDSDFDIDDLPGSLKGGRKRKATITAAQQKKQKVEEEDDSSSDSDENDVDPELLREIQDYFAAKNDMPATSKSDSSEEHGKLQTNKENPVAQSERRLPKVVESAAAEPRMNNVDQPAPSQQSAEVTDFPTVDLTLYDNPVQLESLGSCHLKHALAARGMKCGGTLSERAERLFSVKKAKKNKAPI